MSVESKTGKAMRYALGVMRDIISVLIIKHK